MVSNPAQAAPKRKSPFAFFSGDANGERLNGEWGSTNGSEHGVTGDMIWNESIAGALGYGKKGHPGAAFQWWIPVFATLTCIGSFVAWLVLIIRGRDATDRAMKIMGVDFPWWHSAKAVIIVTAVFYPVFVTLAVAASAWRAYLARTLNIHRPDAKWLSSCRSFQALTAVAHTLLWLLLLLLIFSVGAHSVWGYMTQMLDIVFNQAITLVGPVWSSVSEIADSSRALTDRFNSMLASLPAIGGRRLMEEAEAAAGAAAAQATVGALLAAAGAGGVRELQQTGSPLLNGLGQLAQGIASGLNAAASAIPSVIPGLPENISIPFLPQLLPNGSSNPLFGAITNVTSAIENQIINPTGCPIYCVDLRAQSWWADSSAGCLCNLDRAQASIPYLRKAWQSVIPAVIALVFMYIGASWLLMHGAAQWARTRNEAKLMARIPGASVAQAAAEDAAAKAVQASAGTPPPAPMARV